MKKLFFSILAITIATFTINAQDISSNAIGLRFGDNNGLGTEISYQRYLKENNRLEFNLGWRDSDNVDIIKIVGLYQWVMPLDTNFNWYVGAGGGFGSFDAGNVDGTYGLIAGDIGIEYNFNIPLQLSLDFRPELGFNDDFSDDVDFDIALALRYRF
ncbi:hypothetical protein [Olleya sp. YS]|uniref:hypothetical protein n=1 Tax=Olleya sp. YS TaxID=3028318 RepID=UPI002434111B|nr:hypothetical protein [Olleya sp. YS]WGD35634.1 hypothetical protein Ollyesu_04305 [Olleya sp. YS]